MLENTITLVNDQNEETLAEVMFTFEKDNNNYVILAEVDEMQDEAEEVKVLAYKYAETTDGEIGELSPIELESEWQMVEEMVNTWQESDQFNNAN